MADGMRRIVPFGLRMLPDLKQRVELASLDNGRSLNAEINHRLARSFDFDPIPVAYPSEPLRLPEMPTLRDQFAMAVVGAVFDSAASHNIEQASRPAPWPLTLQDVAAKAYALADAMLAARATEPANG